MSTPAHRRFTIRQLVRPAALAAGLLTGSGCHPGTVVVSTSSAAVGGTIVGVVTGPADASLADRTVTVVNVATGERYQTATGGNGGYSLRVPPGTYRLEIQLRKGEQLAEKAPTIVLNVGDGEVQKNVDVNQNHQ